MYNRMMENHHEEGIHVFSESAQFPSENADVPEFMLTETNTHVAVPVENDYHLRDFLDVSKVFDT